MCAGAGRQAAPVFDGGLEVVALRDVGPASHVFEGGIVGSDHARARSGLNGHVAYRHAALHREGSDGLSGELDRVSRGPADAYPADHAEYKVLGGHSRGKGALDTDLHGLEPGLHDALSRQNELDLCGADTDGKRAERPVRGGVAVAADDGLARLRVALLGADDVHYPLVRAVHVVERDSELRAVAGQGVQLLLGDRVGDWQGAVPGGRVVVGRGDGQIGPSHGASSHAQTVEGLRRGHLVNQVKVHVEDTGLPRRLVYDVCVPYLLEDVLRSHVQLPNSGSR